MLGVLTRWQVGSWPVVWLCLRSPEQQSGRCTVVLVQPWPPCCICNLFSGPCWWHPLANSLPGSEGWTESPLLTPERPRQQDDVIINQGQISYTKYVVPDI